MSILEQDQLEKSVNEYIGRTQEDIFGTFQSQIFQDDIIKTVDASTVQRWLANIDSYIEDLEKLTAYYYISNPNVFQLYDLAGILPSLNYKITAINKDAHYKSNVTKLNQMTKIVKHKQLTRELITQLIGTGTLCGLWVGTSKKPFLYIFDDLKYVFPARRSTEDNGWVIWLDFKWFDNMNDIQRSYLFDVLYPYVKESDYKEYKKNQEKVRFIELPYDRSVCLRTHTLNVNQRFGIPWATQSFIDLLHKEKLRNLEKSIANKVINSVAVLTLGNEKYTDSELKGKKKVTYGEVKRGLEKNQTTNGITVIGIPHWASLVFPDIKTDGLNPEKFESLDKDINSGTSGVMSSINGTTNYSSSSLTIDVMYGKIGVLLEQIETEVYQKMINWVLPKKYSDIYSIEYGKTKPLSTEKKVDILTKLNNSFGTSLKAVIDEVEGVDYDQFIDDTLYEQETLKLQERIKPYSSSYTSTGDNSGEIGAPVVDDPTNESTITTKENDGNKSPKPS